MQKWIIACGSIALVACGMGLTTWAQPSGRTVTRETLTESTEFLRVGDHVINRSQIAYVTRTGRGALVHFVGNVSPLVLFDHGDTLMAQLAPEGGAFAPSLPQASQVPSGGRSPFDTDPREVPLHDPILPSPGSPPTNPAGQPPREVGPPPTPIDPPPAVPTEIPPSGRGELPPEGVPVPVPQPRS